MKPLCLSLLVLFILMPGSLLFQDILLTDLSCEHKVNPGGLLMERGSGEYIYEFMEQ
ncbi:MAG: hypothetical protein GXY51_09080 [Bacteroidetes bacterium]|jgi:hypothetical protein|nr:hypothetical protein [Bacteroidota bacterium]